MREIEGHLNHWLSAEDLQQKIVKDSNKFLNTLKTVANPNSDIYNNILAKTPKVLKIAMKSFSNLFFGVVDNL